MEEVWKVYKETNSCNYGHKIYEVSNLGRVKMNDEIIEPRVSGKYLSIGGKDNVHVMVARCFYPEKFQEGVRMDVHHIDFNSLNNVVTNLVVLTHKEHMQLHHDCDPKYEETKKKIAEGQKGKPRKPFSEEHKKKIGEARKDRKWMTNGKDEMLVFEPWIKDFIIFGWWKGRRKKEKS